MFFNYFTIAMRNLLKHRFYALINIVGLGIGIGCVILIGLYVHNELRYDMQHKNGDRIYRVVRELQAENGQTVYERRVSGAVASSMVKDFPEVEETVRTMTALMWAESQDGKILSHTFCRADPNIFDVFTFPILRGNKESLLQPQSIMLSETAAKQYFGNTDPIGKVLQVEGAHVSSDYTVVGIFKDISKYNTLHFDVLSASMSSWFMENHWDAWIPRASWRGTTVYALFKEHVSIETMPSKLNDMIARNLDPEIAAGIAYHLQPFHEIYLRSRVDYGIQQTYASEGLVVYGDIGNVYAASATALFILLIACVNFMNLTTARAANRAREVGLRKVVGAHRLQLAFQFLGESLILTGVGLLVGMGLVELLLPAFNYYMGLHLSLQVSGTVLMGLVGLTILVGILAGSYPALFLSRFRPVDVLKGTLATGAKGGLFRKILVVFQFATSVVMIVVTLFISDQMAYIQNKDLGFDQELIVETRLFHQYRSSRDRRSGGPIWVQYNMVKDAFLQHPNITGATIARFNHGHSTPQSVFSAYRGGDDEWRMRLNEVDEDFIDVLDIPLVAGRNFSEEAGRMFTITNLIRRRLGEEPVEIKWQDEYILNEAAVKAIGWEDPIGKPFSVKGRRQGRVVGVVKNFHTRSLRETIEPVVLYASNQAPKMLLLKIKPENIQETLAFMETVWKRFVPSRPFNYSFMDDNLRRRYTKEEYLNRAMGVFSTLAIFVACLGLLGLVSFLAEQRKKEVGIRKVLGASAGHVVSLFFKESTVLVLVACVLAWPIAYWSVREWLQHFAYRIEISVFPFLIGGVCMMMLTLITMAYQVVKASRINPVDALRQE